MKRFFCSFFLALLLLLAAGCSPSAETSRTPAEMAAAIQGSQTELPALKRLLPADTDFALWLSDYYGVAPAQVEDGVICYADGPEASEIVVLRLAEDAAPASVEAALRDYLQERASSFDGYAPQQAAMVRSGIVTVRGSYVALMICSDPSVADAAFASCFGKEAAGSTAASPSAASSLIRRGP